MGVVKTTATPPKQVSFEEKAVAVLPKDDIKELGKTILQGMENLLRDRFESKSRSPSPYERGRRFEGSRYDRNKRSDGDTYRRSPDRRQYRYDRHDRRQSPSPRRQSPKWDKYKRRSPRRDRYYSPSPRRDYDRGYDRRRDWDRSRRRSPSPYRDRYYDRDDNASRRPYRYDSRSVSPKPVVKSDTEKGDLNLEELLATATR